MGYNKETEDLSRSRKGRLPLTRRKSRCIIYASGKRTAEVFARPQIPYDRTLCRAAQSWIGERKGGKMSVLNDYTSDEQSLLMQGPRFGAIVVSTASPGRSADTFSEGVAAIQYAMSSQGEFLGNTLISSILYQLDQLAKAEQKFADYNKLATAADAGAQSLARLGQIADLLDLKSDPVEAAGYKQWVLNAATAASQAAKEGANWLGRGGVVVNDAEQAALAEIAAALRLQ
jgi:hypothetical protein